MLRRALIGSCLAAAAAAAPAAAVAPATDATFLATLTDDSGLSVLRPAVAWDERGGRFLVAWSENALGGAGTGSPRRAHGRFIGADGVAAGPAFRIGDGRTGPLVHNDVTGEYGLVVDDLTFRRITRDGVPVEPGVSLTRRSRGAALGSAGLAVNGRTGDYLAVHTAIADGGGREVFAQRIAGDGTPAGPEIQVSQGDATGETPASPDSPAIAWNAVDDGYLVTWSTGSGVVARALAADGTPLGVQRPISGTRPPVFRPPSGPAVVHDPGRDEYLVSWPSGTDVVVQRLTAGGAETGPDDRVVAGVARPTEPTTAEDVAMAAGLRAAEVLVVAGGGPAEDLDVIGVPVAGASAGPAVTVSEGPGEGIDTKRAAVAYAPGPNRYLVAWTATDAAPGTAALSAELYVRVLTAGAASAPVDTRCRTLPPAPAPAAPRGRIRLSETQLRINRRIALAALRRAQAVQAWLASGVRAQDLCQAAIGPAKLRAGAVPGYTGASSAYAEPEPRPVTIPPAVADASGPAGLTVARLLADQRISQAALRRVAAVEARLDAGLTGADIADGAVGIAQLVSGFRPLYVPAAPEDAAPGAATTVVRTPPEPRRVTVTAAQLRINQRIARAALLRADALIRRLQDGIGPDEIRDGTLTAADLAPGVAVSTIP